MPSFQKRRRWRLLGLWLWFSLGPFAAGLFSTHVQLESQTVRSPGGSKILVHAAFDPYGEDAEPAAFDVFDARDRTRVAHIEIQDLGRFVSSIEWLDERWILVRGEEIFYAVLDAEMGRVAARFLGKGLVASPGRHGLAYVLPYLPLYGPRSEMSKGDRVGLAWVPEGEQTWHTGEVFPARALGKSGAQSLSPCSLASKLVWNSEGKRVAFACVEGSDVSAVVLNLPQEGTEPGFERQMVPTEAGALRNLRWGEDGKSLVVETSTGPLVVPIPF